MLSSGLAKVIRHKKVLFALSLLALAGGAVLPLIEGRGGWLPYSLLLAFALAALFWAVAGQKPGRSLLLAVSLAFGLRLLLGLALMQALPVLGYATSEVSQAGYLYKDAYVRDTQAWELAQSGAPLWQAFSGAYSGDQYGGLLWLSALVYRWLSPDLHRPGLILVLTALAGALAAWWSGRAVFHWVAAAEAPLAAKAGLWAAWIAALYPEGFFLGAAHMREGFVIAASALAFDSLVAPHSARRRWLGLVAAFGLLLAFQLPLALATSFVLGGLIYFRSERRPPLALLLTISAVTLLLLGLLVSNWRALPSLAGSGPLQVLTTWLYNNFNFESYVVVQSSGFLQKLRDELGPALLPWIVLVYGVLQPVLPGALVEPAPWLVQTINVLRAAGWYCFGPLLLYTLGLSLAPQNRRRDRLWLLGVGLVWVLLAVASGGGDQWDNPRYRTMFLVWLAAPASWGLAWAHSRRDPWLGRWLAVTGIFVLVFLVWYISRYYDTAFVIGIYPTAVAALLACAAVLGGGWWWDRRKK